MGWGKEVGGGWKVEEGRVEEGSVENGMGEWEEGRRDEEWGSGRREGVQGEDWKFKNKEKAYEVRERKLRSKNKKY